MTNASNGGTDKTFIYEKQEDAEANTQSPTQEPTFGGAHIVIRQLEKTDRIGYRQYIRWQPAKAFIRGFSGTHKTSANVLCISLFRFLKLTQKLSPHESYPV